MGDSTAGEPSDAVNKALKRESDPKLAAAAGEAPSASAAAPPASMVASSSSEGPTSKEGAKTDSDSAPASSDVEGGLVSGNTYKNAALGMTFQFPQGLIPATTETLHAVNDRREAAAQAAILQQHPELRDSPKIAMAKTVFYASRKGAWDGQHVDIPSIRISAVPSRLDSVNLDTFQQTVEKMSAAASLKLTGPPVEFRVKKHPFVRADFDRGVGTVHMYQSMVQTVAGDYLLTIEIYAYSTEELQQMAASLQTIAISDEEP